VDDTEQATQLGQGLAAGRLDRGQRPAGALRVAVEDVTGCGRLHHHDADVVGDHVVQLTGDPRLLLGDRAACLGVPLALGAGRPAA
jgi:hypothetical protein